MLGITLAAACSEDEPAAQPSPGSSAAVACEDRSEAQCVPPCTKTFAAPVGNYDWEFLECADIEFGAGAAITCAVSPTGSQCRNFPSTVIGRDWQAVSCSDPRCSSGDAGIGDATTDDAGSGDAGSEGGASVPFALACNDYTSNLASQCPSFDVASLRLDCQSRLESLSLVGCTSEMMAFVDCAAHAEIECETGDAFGCGQAVIDYLDCEDAFTTETNCARFPVADDDCNGGAFAFACLEGVDAPASCTEIEAPEANAVIACCPPFPD